MGISATKPTTSTGKMYHINCGHNDLPSYVLVPGDPGRVKTIAELWTDQYVVSDKRGLLSMRGTYEQKDIGACATGMGGPSAAIVAIELAGIGTETMIRVGSCGSIVPNIREGNLVIIEDALSGYDGITQCYFDVLPERFVVTPRIKNALLKAALQQGYNLEDNLHFVTTATTSDFFLGQGRPLPNSYDTTYSQKIVDEVREKGAKIFEMEASVLFALAKIMNYDTGGICGVVANRVTNSFLGTNEILEMERDLGKIASEAVRLLYEES